MSIVLALVYLRSYSYRSKEGSTFYVLLVLVLVGLLLLMSLFCRAKNLSPPTMRDSVVQFYNMKSLIVGCWNDLTGTHKLPFALKLEESCRKPPS